MCCYFNFLSCYFLQVAWCVARTSSSKNALTLSFNKVLVNVGHVWKPSTTVEIRREGYYLIHFGFGVPAGKEVHAWYDLRDLYYHRAIATITRYSHNGTDTLGETMIMYLRSHTKLGIQVRHHSFSNAQMQTTFMGLFLYRGNWV